MKDQSQWHLPYESTFIIGRPINGISLNGLEYLLNDDQTEMEFETKEVAVQFLRDNGFDSFSPDELEDSFMFVELVQCDDCTDKFRKEDMFPWRYEPEVKLCEGCTHSRDEEEER